MVAEAAAGLGGLDLYVNSAGGAWHEPLTHLTRAAWENTMATNVAASVYACREAGRLFARQRRGAIVVLSSVAGDRGRIANYVYGAAKAALSTYLQGLRARLWRAGVAVVTVKPGPVDTAMTFGLDRLPLLVPPHVVAEACLKAARRGTEIVYVPGPWRLIMAIIRHIPERIFKRLKI